MSVPESTFTTSRDFCRRPERWHSVDVLATEDEVTELVAAMVRAVQPDYVVETGTYRGHTARAIGMALVNNGHGTLHTVEIDDGFAEEAMVRCAGLPVEVTVCDSRCFLPTTRIDLAWFDSGPYIRGEEFRAFYPMMHSQTIVGFHDAGPQHEVMGQVDALVSEGVLARPLLIHSPRGVCFANVIR